MTIFRHRMQGPGAEGDIWVATMHSDSAQTLPVVHAAFVGFVGDFIGLTVVPLWPTNVSCTEIQTDALTATGHNAGQMLSSVSYVGTATGKTLPQRVSLVCGLRTAIPTRAGRGRFSLPGLSADSLTATGLWTSAVQSTIAANLANKLSAMTTATLPVIYHRSTNSDTPIGSVTIGSVPGSQRRRTNKVPENYVTADL